MEQSKWAMYLKLFAFLLFWGVICFLLYYFFWSDDKPEKKPIMEKKKTEQVSSSSPLSNQVENDANKNQNPYLIPHSSEEMTEAKRNLELYLRSYYEIEHNGPKGLKQDLAPYASQNFLTRFDELNAMFKPVTIQKLIILPAVSNQESQIQLNCFMQISDLVISKTFMMNKEANGWVVTNEEDR